MSARDCSPEGRRCERDCPGHQYRLLPRFLLHADRVGEYKGWAGRSKEPRPIAFAAPEEQVGGSSRIGSGSQREGGGEDWTAAGGGHSTGLESVDSRWNGV